MLIFKHTVEDCYFDSGSFRAEWLLVWEFGHLIQGWAWAPLWCGNYKMCWELEGEATGCILCKWNMVRVHTVCFVHLGYGSYHCFVFFYSECKAVVNNGKSRSCFIKKKKRHRCIPNVTFFLFLSVHFACFYWEESDKCSQISCLCTQTGKWSDSDIDRRSEGCILGTDTL